MTDNDIINDLAYKVKHMETYDYMLLPDIFRLINRQKAEIDKLKTDKQLLTQDDNANTAEINGLRRKLETAKSEAIKEFAERLKRNITINNTNDGYLDYSVDYNCLMEDIDDVVKEMVGEK